MKPLRSKDHINDDNWIELLPWCGWDFENGVRMENKTDIIVRVKVTFDE